MTDARPGEARVGVRRIVDERNAAPAQITEDLGARHVQQRTDENVTAVWNARQPRQARAAHDPVEDGLGLIVRLMAERDPVRAVLARERCQRAQARLPGGVLKGQAAARPALARDVDADGRKSQPERVGAIADEIDLAPRVRAQTVIDRRHLQGQAEPRAHLPQDVQQGHRVGPARHGDDDAIAATQEIPRGDGGENGRQHVETAMLALYKGGLE